MWQPARAPTSKSSGLCTAGWPRNSGSVDLWHDFGRGFSAGTGVAFAAGRKDVHAATFATIDGEDYTVVRVYGIDDAAVVLPADTYILDGQSRPPRLVRCSIATVGGMP